MSRSLTARIETLERQAPPPVSPLDGMTGDELRVMIIEQLDAVLGGEHLTPDERSAAETERRQLAWPIIETVNLASGRWATIPGLNNYQEHTDSARRHWERIRPDQSEYVPSLNHDIERDGFAYGSYPAAPDLMARREKLWAHPIVHRIVKDAPRHVLPVNHILQECSSFRAGHHGPSTDCSPQCARQCLNARRGGFQMSLSQPSIRRVAQ